MPCGDWWGIWCYLRGSAVDEATQSPLSPDRSRAELLLIPAASALPGESPEVTSKAGPLSRVEKGAQEAVPAVPCHCLQQRQGILSCPPRWLIFFPQSAWRCYSKFNKGNMPSGRSRATQKWLWQGEECGGCSINFFLCDKSGSHQNGWGR